MIRFNKLLVCCCFIFLLTFKAYASDVGKVWQAEKKTWVDPEYGHEITQWTDYSTESWHLYFNIETFIDSDYAIIFSNRTGGRNLFKLDLNNGQMIQMTDNDSIDNSVWHWSHLKTLWYIADSQLMALSTETLSSQSIIKLDEVPRSFTISCDGKWFIYAVDKSIKGSDRKNIGPYAIFKMNLETKKIEQISPDYGFIIGHLQANPVDPTIISYCWQHLYREGNYPGIRGYTPIRIWWLDINGTNGGPVCPQEFGIHRTHEFWFPDGKRIGYSARYKFGPDSGKQFVGSCKADGSDNYLISAPVRFAHSQMFKDGKHWVVDYYDGMVLTLLTIENRQIAKVNHLFRHDSSWESQASHPHPHFSPNGKYIMFSTDKTGIANVYSVKIDLK